MLQRHHRASNSSPCVRKRLANCMKPKMQDGCPSDATLDWSPTASRRGPEWSRGHSAGCLFLHLFQEAIEVEFLVVLILFPKII